VASAATNISSFGFDRPEWYNGFEDDPEEAGAARSSNRQQLLP
jgi:hypothetical protein